MKEGPAPGPPLRPSLPHGARRRDRQIGLGSPVSDVRRDLTVRIVQRDLPTDLFCNRGYRPLLTFRPVVLAIDPYPVSPASQEREVVPVKLSVRDEQPYAPRERDTRLYCRRVGGRLGEQKTVLGALQLCRRVQVLDEGACLSLRDAGGLPGEHEEDARPTSSRRRS